MGDFDNDGAMMDVDETLMCKFIRVKHEKKQKGIQKKPTMGRGGPYSGIGRGGFGNGTMPKYKGY